MDINHNLVKGCELCDVFSSVDKYELVYPRDRNLANKVDYIIIRCLKCPSTYLLILRDHTEYITNEMFGKILYFVRREFKRNVRIDTSTKHCEDHFHCHINVDK